MNLNGLPVMVKVTGDLLCNNSVLDSIAALAETRKVWVLVGGGTQINAEIEKRKKQKKWKKLLVNYVVDKRHGGRYVCGLPAETRNAVVSIASSVLNRNKNTVAKKLQRRNARMENIEIIIPVIQIAGYDCHIDADHFATSIGCNSCARVWIVTEVDRVEEKRKTLHRWLTDYPECFSIVLPEQLEKLALQPNST